MNGRLLLLVLVTVAFMTAWDGDQAAMETALARRAERQKSMQLANATAEPPAETQVVRSRHKVTSVSHTNPATAKPPRSSVPVVAAAVASTLKDVPMPTAIAAGVYRAVNQKGETLLIAISKADATATTPQDFYVTDAADGSRWFLVRITR